MVVGRAFGDAESTQLSRQVRQPLRDQLSVLVVAERADRGPGSLEVLPGTVEVVEPAVALAQVQGQRGVQPGGRDRHPLFRDPLTDQVGGGQRPLPGAPS